MTSLKQTQSKNQSANNIAQLPRRMDRCDGIEVSEVTDPFKAARTLIKAKQFAASAQLLNALLYSDPMNTMALQLTLTLYLRLKDEQNFCAVLDHYGRFQPHSIRLSLTAKARITFPNNPYFKTVHERQ